MQSIFILHKNNDYFSMHIYFIAAVIWHSLHLFRMHSSYHIVNEWNRIKCISLSCVYIATDLNTISIYSYESIFCVHSQNKISIAKMSNHFISWAACRSNTTYSYSRCSFFINTVHVDIRWSVLIIRRA